MSKSKPIDARVWHGKRNNMFDFSLFDINLLKNSLTWCLRKRI